MAPNGQEVLAPQTGQEKEETGRSDLDPEQSPASSLLEEDDSGDEWDTDLEADANREMNKRDHRGVRSISPTELYLEACRVSGVVPASDYLRQLGATSLNLTHHGLGPLGAKALAIALVSDMEISCLELEDNFLLAEGTQYLMDMLKENDTIQSLNLSNNHLRSAGADSIARMLLYNSSIKSMKLAGNHFIDEAAKNLANSLANNYNVKDVDLSHNQFCEMGGEHLGQMLANNEGLEILNLSWNHLRMSGAVALCAGLKANVTLKQLDVSWNGLGSAGARALGDALRHNNSLLLLDLSNNRVNDEGAALLGLGLAANDSLRVLRMAHNPLTQAGALTLLTAVKNNPKSALEEINISTVLVSRGFVELLEAARQDHAALEVQYQAVIGSIARTKDPSVALKIFQRYLEEQKEGLMDFFQALDKQGTMHVSNSDFRKAALKAKIPLEQHQLEWLIQNFDKDCTGSIEYRQFAEQES